MADLAQYTRGAVPPEIDCQIRMAFSLIMNADGVGEERFADPFAHSEAMEHFVLMERGLLISHADVSERTITHLGETYRMCGVGEVMTHPAFRHEGHGQRVVAAATEYIFSRDADIAMLFTGTELEPFYAGNGWVALSNHAITFGDPVQPKARDEFVMMLFLSDKGKTRRADFERGPIYVGASMW
ncbi:MAG: GNAT family N-acetyltransferase [Chloroflexi bacterium]|nr:GNAT family N-acetyltransferase [Chloroflexota bacterium]